MYPGGAVHLLNARMHHLSWGPHIPPPQAAAFLNTEPTQEGSLINTWQHSRWCAVEARSGRHQSATQQVGREVAVLKQEVPPLWSAPRVIHYSLTCVYFCLPFVLHLL